MLVDFTVSNYGPFKDSATLSMVATSAKDNLSSIYKVPGRKERLLTSAAVFGPNASGKSYILEAIYTLKKIVSTTRPESEHIPGYFPFRLSNTTLGAPVEFCIRLMLDSTIYDYRLSYTSREITGESLTYHSKNDVITSFGRGTFHGNVDDNLIRKTTKTSAYLTVAASFNNQICSRVLEEIKGIIYKPSHANNVHTSLRMAEEDPRVREDILSALYSADFGITSFSGEKMNNSDDDDSDNKYNFFNPYRLYFSHSHPNSDVDSEMTIFPADIESEGTLEIFAIMGHISRALRNGHIVIIDEFGSNLHPVLNRWIISLFNNNENKNGSQLILNTHDLLLMDSKVLRRDQIWFTNKSHLDGSSELYSLSDFDDVSKKSNYLKLYLYGRFDAVPSIVGRRLP